MVDAADNDMDDADRSLYEKQAGQYYNDNLYHIKRMDCAFKTLHADLGQIQRVLADFVKE